MVQLLDSDIRTREVLSWQGLHLLYHPASSCSKKVRMFLNLKGIPWTSRIVNVMRGENYEEWFMGINPRGLVPVLVDDGVVHIESNDILLHLEEKFPEPNLIPSVSKVEMVALLAHEDDLHLDLRTLTVRFLVVGRSPAKPEGVLERYRNSGSGTVRGERDAEKDVQIGFWEKLAREGVPDEAVPDEAVKHSALRFFSAFSEIEQRLSGSPYLLGDYISLLDIAWFIYTDRLIAVGYPLASLHPKLVKWHQRLCENPAFASEITPPPGPRQSETAVPIPVGLSLSEIAGF